MQTVNLSGFVENPDNPQTVTDEAFADLVESVRRDPETLAANKIAYVTDYVSPISGTDLSGRAVVIAGNKRLRALKKIHGENADVPADWFFDLTPLGLEARRRWLVRSNVQTGDWDAELLMKLYSKDELSSLMDADALDEICRVVESAPAKAKKDADEVPAVNAAEPPRSRRGGVYALGPHRLMCGDSTSLADVAALMGGKKADLLVTDPPYNVDYEGAAGKIMNDSMGDSDFLKFLASVYRAGDSVMRPGAAFYIWHADSEVGYNFRGAARTVGWQIRECLVWVKDSLVLGRQDYQWRHEPCLYGWKDGAAHTWRSGRKQTTVMELIPESVETDGDVVRFHVSGRTFQMPSANLVEVVDTTVIPLPKPTASKLHPTMKPVSLFAYQIRNSSEVDDTVLDLFGGSGTTVIACEDTHRKACLMELDPKFVDVIRRRWAEYVHGDGCDWVALTPEIPQTPSAVPSQGDLT